MAGARVGLYMQTMVTVLSGLVVHATTAFAEPSPGEIKMIQSDIQRLKDLKFSRFSPLFKNVFGAQNAGPSDYFLKRVERIGFSDQRGNHVGAEYSNGILTLYPGYFDQIDASRLSMLIHESAHADFIYHDQCPSPYYFILPPAAPSEKTVRTRVPELENLSFAACDTRITQSYAIEFIFASALLNDCSSCSPTFQEEARLVAETRLLHVMNPSVARSLVDGTSPPNRAD